MAEQEKIQEHQTEAKKECADSCCSCHGHGHEHEHEHEHKHEHKHEHEHGHEEEHCSCGCGHHHEHDHDDGCGCGHHHDHDDDCGCGCGCGHDHGESEGRSVSRILRYALGAIPVIVGFLGFLPWFITIPAAVLGYLIFGFEVWRGMISGFAKKRIFTEFTLMCVATLGAFAIGEYADAAAVMFLYSLGESISDGAYSRSRKNISELLEITPEYATAVRGGEHIRVAPEEVRAGEEILVVSGERIPLDGTVIEGGGNADTSSVTGEAKPLELYAGVAVTSGSVLTDGAVRIRVESEYESSVVARLAAAVKDAEARKSQSEKKIGRFARIFTPLAFAVAAAVAVVGGALSGAWTEWIRVGLSVLVISCPCSLVLSVPLTYFAGLGAGARRGVIFKGGEVIDSMSRLGAVAFDKTGTLTESEISFDGAAILGDIDKEEFLQISYDVLLNSPHAAALSYCQGFSGEAREKASAVEVIGGRGIICLLGGKRAVFGNAALMREQGADIADHPTTAIFGMLDGSLLGRLDFSSKAKEGASDAVAALKREGIRVALLSGDSEVSVRDSAKELGIEEYYYRLTPSDKLERFEKIYKEEKAEGRRTVAFCGDGLNDSAAVMRADVGIAMGKSGSALTVSSADLIIMDDSPQKLCVAYRLAKRISRIGTSNIVLSLAIKAAVLCAGIILTAVSGKGISMELAIVADVGAAVLTVLNALRASK